jgi:hypothetical protein
MLSRIRAIVFLVGLISAVGPALGQDRVALVIGNGGYLYTAPLTNPLADARAVSERLRQIGFEVDLVEDLRSADARAVLGRFAQKSQLAEIATIFYAGHGIEIGGTNYLVPVDARMETEAAAEFEAISLDDVVRAVRGARKLGLVMLDACRDNPFASKMARRDGTRSLSRGLAPVEVHTQGLLISFAAEAGRTAADGTGAHSPYSQALLDVLQEPGVEIGFMFRKMRGKIVEATNGRQTPMEHMLLPDEAIYLAPAIMRPAEVPAEAPAAVEPEGALDAAITAAIKVNTPRGWQLLLRNHGPDVLSRPEAAAAFAELQKRAGAADPAQAFEGALAFTPRQRADLQVSLNSAGYYAGSADGEWGSGTRAGIRQLQSRLGVEATGFVDAAVLEFLGILWQQQEDAFVNAPFAAVHDTKLLQTLGEDQGILSTLDCLGRRRSVYGRRGDSYYFVVISSDPIQLAAQNFENCGGYMASVTSEEENEFVFSMIADEPEFYQFGFNHKTGYSYKLGPYFGLWQDPDAREPDGGWRWRNGEELSYTNWVPSSYQVDKTVHDFGQFYAERRGQVDMKNVDARHWFANTGFIRSAVMEANF